MSIIGILKIMEVQEDDMEVQEEAVSAHTLWELRPNLTVYQSGPDTTFPNFMVILYFAFCNLITTIQEHKTKH